MQHRQNNLNLPDQDEILLGELLAGAQDFQSVASVLSSGDFSRLAHKLIFERMADLHQRGEIIDRVTVANELMKENELQDCGGLTYIVKLDGYGRGEFE